MDKTQTPGRSNAIALCIIVIFLAVFSLKLDSPPAVVEADAPDNDFSARRAYRYLEEISRAPHSTGTEENRRVREYIASVCREYGLDVTIQQANAVWQRRTTVAAANVFNVVARMKGTAPMGKSLIVMAHYDSQPNTPAAGDDGAGVAAMLETIRILKANREQFSNDIIFLFTDAEESGLSGAAGFVQDSLYRAESGLVLNFDVRGNAGTSTLFEVNPENGWAIAHFKEAAAHTRGNSLGYEIYKLLPNDTDYSIFRRAGIAGLNHGFVEGFVNYHSPTDTPEHLDLRSLQQLGNNMLSLVRHFGTVSLSETKAADITFFNVAGEIMVTYPAGLNIIFTTLTVLSTLGCVILGFRRKLITVKGLLAGFFAFVGLLVVLALVGAFFARGAEGVYPLYKHFYASNSYNAGAYFIAMAALSVLIASLAYGWLVKKTSVWSLLSGVWLLAAILLILMQISMPTAVFILLFPLFFLTASHLLFLTGWLDLPEEKSGVQIIRLIGLLPAVLWMPPMIWQMFVVFGLSPPVGGVTLLCGLSFGLFLPVIFEWSKVSGRALPLAALSVFLVALVVGHMQSGYNADKPLRSSVYYQQNADTQKARWMSDFTEQDEFSKRFVGNGVVENNRLVADADWLGLAPPEMTIKSDTLVGENRKLHLHFTSKRNAITARMRIDEGNPARKLSVIGPAGPESTFQRESGPVTFLNYVGLDSTGFDVVVEIDPSKVFSFTLSDRTMGLPSFPGKTEYPPGIVPGTDWNANTTQVIKTFSFEPKSKP